MSRKSKPELTREASHSQYEALRSFMPAHARDRHRAISPKVTPVDGRSRSLLQRVLGIARRALRRFRKPTTALARIHK